MAKKKVAYSRIRELREQRGLSQAKMAAIVGVTTNTIQNYENGTSGVAVIERVLKIAELLGCSPEDLLGFKEVEVGDSEFEFSLEDIRALGERLPPLEDQSKTKKKKPK